MTSVDSTLNPTRLTLARKRRGFSKTELAQKVGVDLRAISAYEAGEYPPSKETMAALASALVFPIAFFFGDDLDEPTPDSASFRAMSKMTAAKRDMALGQGAIAIHLNRWFEAQFELPPPNLPNLSQEPTPEAAAETLRSVWGVGVLPIRNMVHILEANGVRVFSLDVQAREVDAFSIWKGSTPFVFLNCYKSTEHSRFDAAHELGHLVLHKHASPHGREAEREADAFASAFLMPRASILANAPRFPTLAGLIDKKRFWITSVAALNYRLHALRITSDWQYRGLCVQIAQRGFREVEPSEAPRESSQALQKMLKSFQDEGTSRAQIAQMLSIPRSELEHLMFGLAIAGLEGGRSGGPAFRNAPQPNLSIVKGRS